jgi:hypothetical protein
MVDRLAGILERKGLKVRCAPEGIVPARRNFTLVLSSTSLASPVGKDQLPDDGGKPEQ